MFPLFRTFCSPDSKPPTIVGEWEVGGGAAFHSSQLAELMEVITVKAEVMEVIEIMELMVDMPLIENIFAF